jgi:hypothetical protein
LLFRAHFHFCGTPIFFSFLTRVLFYTAACFHSFTFISCSYIISTCGLIHEQTPDKIEPPWVTVSPSQSLGILLESKAAPGAFCPAALVLSTAGRGSAFVKLGRASRCHCGTTLTSWTHEQALSPVPEASGHMLYQL